MRRVQIADGRTRAFVNDQPVSVQVLRALGAALVEIHGQHDERAFIEAGTHRALLDAFGGLEAAAAEVRGLWQERRAREAAVAAHRADVERAGREAEWLRHAVEELGRLAPERGEEAALAERRAAMMQAEKVAEDLRADARERHRPAVAGAAARHRRAAARAPRRAGAGADRAGREGDRRRAHRARRGARASRAGAARRRIRSARTRAHRGAPVRAARRRAQVQRSGRRARRAGPPLRGRSRSDRRRRRAARRRWSRRRARSRRATGRPRQALSAARRGAAATLDKAVNAELKPLKLERAQFSTEIGGDGEGPDGLDRVEFWVRTNPGTRPGPLMKVASGGELARFLLALKVVLADRGSAPTLDLRRDRYRRRRRHRRRDRRRASRGSRRACR